MPPSVFTDEEIKEIHHHAQAVWDAIGRDCLRAIEDCGEAKPGQAVMPQSHVIEVVLDAGQMTNPMGGPKWSSPELRTRFEKLEYKAKKALLKPAFPYARYGW